MRIEDIETELIDIPSGRRAVDPDWAKAIGEDFAINGQKTPIDVIELKEPFVKDKPRYRLVTGGHRLEAKKIFQAPTIIARIYDQSEFVNEASIRLAEITENFMRRELTVLDRAFDVSAWREIYEQVNGAVKRGGDHRSKQAADQRGKSAPLILDEVDEQAERFAASFTEAAQKAFGMNKDAIKRSLRIARIDGTVRTRISLHRIANNQSELLDLCIETAERQASITGLLLSDPPAANSVSEARAIIDRVQPAAKPEAWAKVSDQFMKLSDAAKRRFISENWDFIEAMLAEKAAA